MAAAADAENAVPENGAVTDAKAVKKERVKSLPRPNREEHDAQLAQLEAIISSNTERIDAIKSTINERRMSRKMQSTDTSLLRSRLAELTAAFKAKLEEKNAIKAELAQSDTARDNMREQLRALRERLGRFSRAEDIDAEIAKLEHEIAHTSMPLNEEKKKVLQIKELSKSRDELDGVRLLTQKINEHEAVRKMISETIRQKDAEISQIKQEQVQQKQVLESLRSKEQEELGDVPALNAEKDKLYQQIKSTRETISQLKSAFREKENEWWKVEKVVREQLREEKKKRWEEQQAERKRRDEERKRREEENAPEPYTEEVDICDQLCAYLSKWSEDAPEASTSAPAAAAAPAAPANGRALPEGVVLKGKKGAQDDELERILGGLGKGKKGAKKQELAAPAKPAANTRLTHAMDALSSFNKIGLLPPTTVGEVPKAKEAVAAKKVRFLELRKTALEKKAAAKAAAAEAKANGDTSVQAKPELLVSMTLTVSGKKVAVDLTVL